MKTIHYELNNFTIKYDLKKLSLPEEAFFLDIETTGFSPKTSSIYLIGGAYYRQKQWRLIQWFAEEKEEEKDILLSFYSFLKSFTTLFHFNGNRFDLPFLIARSEVYGIKDTFDAYYGIDIYKRIASCRHFLSLPNCKQKSIELFLNIQREDKFSGGELIRVYQEYLSEKDREKEQLLLLHHRDDLKGMLEILPILSYSDLFHLPVRTTKVQSNSYHDLNGKKQQELLLKIKLPTPVPLPLSYHVNDCYVTLEEDHGVIRIPVYTEELKYFYQNHKDYYYLPMEDMAIHKSVASFVDKEHRIPATASTCYTRKFSAYLPQWDYLFSPFFQREYKSPLIFFELTEEFKKNREDFSTYASHILQMMGKSR